MASKPRNDSTAIDTAAITVARSRALTPNSTDDQGRVGPSTARTTVAAIRNTTSTASSTTSTTNPTRAATATPARFSAVVAVKAAAVKTHAGTAGTRACSARPEKRYATAGMSR